MKKTFYSVKYRDTIRCQFFVRWFDDLTEARKFSKDHISDPPVPHTYSNEFSIEEIEYRIKMQKEKKDIFMTL